MQLIEFMVAAYRAYQGAKAHGSAYTAVVSHGVPKVCVFVGIGREAWRVSQRAIQEYELKERTF